MKDIWKLWLSDIADILYECIEPLLIGFAIDDLMKKQYVGIICFAGVFLIRLIISYFSDVQNDIVHRRNRMCGYIFTTDILFLP